MSEPARDARVTRRVEPVSDEFDPNEIFDPERGARPLAAWLLALGPLLALAGLAGWLRLLAGIPQPFPRQVDPWALAWNGVLLAQFVLPHSLFARGFGRRWLNQPFGPAGERPLYVLATGASLCLLAFTWRSSGPLLWNHGGVMVVLARALQVAGLLLAGWGTVSLGVGNLFGISSLRSLRHGRQPPTVEFTAHAPYRYLRHPIDLGNLMLLAGMPEATLDRLLLLVVLAAWMLVSANWEERDAEMTFGDAYRAYKQRTPRWWPRLREERK